MEIFLYMAAYHLGYEYVVVHVFVSRKKNGVGKAFSVFNLSR